MKLALTLPRALPALSDRGYRAIALCVWAAAAGLSTWVVIQWMAPAPVVAQAMPADMSAQFQMDQSAEARLLGVETAGGLTPPSVSLMGVFAAGDGTGAAVLSIEGQPAQSKSVGDEVANGWTLDEVGPTFAVMGRSGQRVQLNLPVLQADPNLLKRAPE
ncbi:hypothetical protein NQT62_14460 [Limnobacter humi]|uniref:Type II secretion system protein GspC N-terminal domain-containing protein n=1 Tax=Limnobacter humi TaxID=1778671 RepID=A0ABT1WJG0_9BURK|nr:type II secretion system protein N [Limnobacter humi]MCQ8897641.1 hypothetical protein [Limnobacter humi]